MPKEVFDLPGIHFLDQICSIYHDSRFTLVSLLTLAVRVIQDFLGFHVPLAIGVFFSFIWGMNTIINCAAGTMSFSASMLILIDVSGVVSQLVIINLKQI